MTNLVETPALDVALAHIDMVGWGSKANVIHLIRAGIDDDGVTRISAREVADFFGWEQKRGAEDLLKQLVADRVLILVERRGGSVGHGYRINPEVAQWRNVPWRSKLAERYGAGFLEVIIHRVLEAALPRPLSGRRRRFVPRRITGAQAEFVPRRVAGAQNSAAPRPWPGAQIAGRAPTMHRGTNSAVAPPHMPITPPIGEREGLQRLFEAITRRGGRVWGTKLRELRELVAGGELDVDAAVAVIEHGKWEQPIGPTIVDYLWTMAGQITAEGHRLAAERRAREEAAAEAERERLAAEQVLQELRENPEAREGRMADVWSALGRVPVSQNGHNGQNGKEPTGA